MILQADVALEEIFTRCDMLCLFVFVCIYREPLNTSGINGIRSASEESFRSLFGVELVTAPLSCPSQEALEEEMDL